MRVVLFLSRFTFICNIAFLLFVFFNRMEKTKPVKAVGDRVIEVPIVKDLVITLGFTAIFINLIMNIIYVFLLFSGKLKITPRWLIVANLIFFLAQIYYYFLF